MNNIPANKKKIQTFNAILHTKGLMADKANIVAAATNDRTSHSSQLFEHEVDELIASFSQLKTNKPSKQMMGKMFAIAHEMGWVTKNFKANAAGALVEVNNYSRLYGWVLKFGYLKKSLNLYTHAEFPKLLTQFEMGVYQQFLKQKK